MPGEGAKGASSPGQRVKGATVPGTRRERGSSRPARALRVSYPMYDQHGEALDYLDDLEQSKRNQDTWRRLIVDVPINRQLEQARQETLARDLQEAALLQGQLRQPRQLRKRHCCRTVPNEQTLTALSKDFKASRIAP